MSQENNGTNFNDLMKQILSGKGISYEDISNLDLSTVPDKEQLAKLGGSQVASFNTPFGVGIGIGGETDQLAVSIIKKQEELISKLEESILKLTETNESLRKEIRERDAQANGLEFPDDFIFSNSGNLVGNKTIQDLISDLVDIEVPEYSYAVIQHDGVLAIKTNDDEGISYYVTTEYYTAQPL